DIATGKEVTHFDREEFASSPGSAALAFSPDGKRLASLGGSGILLVTEIATGKERRRHRFPEGHDPELAFSPDGTLLAVATGRLPTIKGQHEVAPDQSRKTFLWEIQEGKKPRLLKAKPVGRMGGRGSCMSFSTDGKTLAVVEDGSEVVHLW